MSEKGIGSAKYSESDQNIGNIDRNAGHRRKRRSSIKHIIHFRQYISYFLYYQVKYYDIWTFGIILTLAGQLSYWNNGLSAGLGSFAIATVIMGLSYVCLIACTSEIMSALPLPGGSYMFTRCLVGFYCGYAVGCLQLLAYILLGAISMYTFVQSIVEGYLQRSVSSHSYPLLFFVFYTIATIIYFLNGKVFWGLNLITAILGLVIITIFVFGSIKYTSFHENAPIYQSPYSKGYDMMDKTALVHNHWFVGGLSNFLHVFPKTLWFYIGIEPLVYTAHDIFDPKKNLPKPMFISMLTIFVTSLAILFIVASLPLAYDGIGNTNSLLYSGYHLISSSFSIRGYNLLLLPIQFGSFYGFMYSYGKVMYWMSISHLLPHSLMLTLTKRLLWSRVPKYSIITGNTIGYGLCIAMWKSKEIWRCFENMSNIAIYLVSIFIVMSYFKMRAKFQGKREFILPFGYTGAIFCGLVSLIGLIATLGFVHDNGTSIAAVAMYIGIFTTHYFCFVIKGQKFTNDEMKITFSSLIVKFNNRVKQNMKKGQVAPEGKSIHIANGLTGLFKSTSIRLNNGESSSSKGSIMPLLSPHKRNPFSSGLNSPISVRSSKQQTPLNRYPPPALLSSKDSSSISGSSFHPSELPPSRNSLQNAIRSSVRGLFSNMSVRGNTRLGSIHDSNGMESVSIHESQEEQRGGRISNNNNGSNSNNNNNNINTLSEKDIEAHKLKNMIKPDENELNQDKKENNHEKRRSSSESIGNRRSIRKKSVEEMVKDIVDDPIIDVNINDVPDYVKQFVKNSVGGKDNIDMTEMIKTFVRDHVENPDVEDTFESAKYPMGRNMEHTNTSSSPSSQTYPQRPRRGSSISIPEINPGQIIHALARRVSSLKLREPARSSFKEVSSADISVDPNVYKTKSQDHPSTGMNSPPGSVVDVKSLPVSHYGSQPISRQLSLMKPNSAFDSTSSSPAPVFTIVPIQRKTSSLHSIADPCMIEDVESQKIVNIYQNHCKAETTNSIQSSIESSTAISPIKSLLINSNSYNSNHRSNSVKRYNNTIGNIGNINGSSSSSSLSSIPIVKIEPTLEEETSPICSYKNSPDSHSPLK